MSATVAFLAFPTTVLVLLGLLRSPAARRFVSPPREDRWHRAPTPYLGGIGIFAGIVVGCLAALAAGAVSGSHEELGILAGCSLLFLAGLLDDAFSLPPVAKLAAQL